MNAEGLLAHYARIADAPDAITKLRRLVLDLAVRGKLVPQEGSDVSSERALGAARKWLAAEAETTKRLRWKPSQSVSIEEFDHEIPKGWVLARVNDTGFYINGLAFRPSDWKPSGLPIIRIQNLTDEAKDFNYTAGDYPDEVIVRTGDLLVSWSATLDAFQWTRPPGVLNQHIFRVIPAPQLTNKSFLLLLLRNAIREMAEGEHAHGLVMTHINRGPFTAHVVLIPPLSEQERIVAKVDELMALCDQLEAARAQREATRDRLAATSLARLNTPDPDTFRADARFALDALPALTTRPDQIKQLRQTILNLAVHGKLVPQATNEGTGTQLISELAAARCSTELPERMSKRRISQGAVGNDEKYLHAPSSWGWARLVEIGKTQTGTSPSSSDPSLFGNYIPFIKPSDLDNSEIRYEGPGLSQTGIFRSRLADKDSVLMVCIGATLGKVNTTNRPICFNQQINSVTPYIAGMSSYVALALKASDFQALAWSKAGTGTLPIISKGKWELLPIPVPPLAEQRRIVAKVDELMSLCDQLEASFTTSETARSRLLDALLHEALARAPMVNVEHPRAAVSGYVVSRLASKRNFGRTTHMKHLYLAESRLGLKLGGRYERKAAGPLDTGIYELEKQAEAAGWYTHKVETLRSSKEKVIYVPGKALKSLVEEGVAVLGPSRKEMDRLIDLMGGLRTEQVEIIATLFAAWNDALLDGHAPDDDWIVKEVREHWHASKQRFTPTELHTWLGWMRQNDVVPLGHPPRTMQQTTMEL